MQPFALIRPTTLLAARDRVHEHPRARLFRAGGVDLLDRMKEGLDAPAELIDLRKRLKRAETERDILKKATAFFAKENA